MKILYIWDADYPWDIRVEKICNSLNKFGHEVHIASRNLNKLQQYELINGLHVHRMKFYSNSKLNYIISFPAFFSPVWKIFINNIIEIQKINAIIVRDLPMAAAGIWAGKKYNIPVIYDMAEDYCAMIREIWKNRKYHGVNLIVRNPYLAKIVENYVIDKFNHIVVVTEEARGIVINEGVNIENISIIGNTPILQIIKNTAIVKNEDIDFIKSRYGAIYTGGITSDRGISVVIDALPRIIEKIPDFLFVVIGRGYATEKYLDLIQRRKLQNFVRWIGWVDHDKLYDYIRASKIGLIPHNVSDHTNTTIPNKIFDYMVCGIPVVASNAVPMMRIINEEKCGKIFISGKSVSLADAIISLYKDDYGYGENGKAAVQNKYNWENEEITINKIIEHFSIKENTDY